MVHNAGADSAQARRSSASGDEHQVIPFRRPDSPVKSGIGRHAPRRAGQSAAPPVAGLEKYEGREDEDNYRHRMMVNLAAVLVTVVLSLAGIWLAMQIADLRKNQDCALSGRRNCMPVDVNRLER